MVFRAAFTSHVSVEPGFLQILHFEPTKSIIAEKTGNATADIETILNQ